MRNGVTKFILGNLVITNHKYQCSSTPIINCNSTTQEKQTVAIVGGGIVGLTSAYYLTNNPNYHVTLIEKNSKVCLETTSENGCILNHTQIAPWISMKSLKALIRSMIFEDSYYSINLIGFLTDLNWHYWLVNVMDLFFCSGKITNSAQTYTKIHNRSLIEWNKFFQDNTVAAKCFSGKGHLLLYKNSVDAQSAAKAEGDVVYQSSTELQELLGSEYNLSNYNYGIQNQNGSCLNGKLFCEELEKLLLQRSNFKLLTNTTLKSINFETNTKKVKGINTSKGQLEAENVVIAAGYFSKEILNDIGIKLPLIGLKGYTCTFESTQNMNPKNELVLSDKANNIFVAPIYPSYFRISCIAQLAGNNLKIDNKLVESIVSRTKSLIPSSKFVRAWSGLRPVTADDVPIVGKIPNYKGLYLNVGHGGRGLTFSMGSAWALDKIIKNENLEEFAHSEIELDRFRFY